ncbi:hypothetical protein Sjap_023377 [Stephania japonica]|uniref:Uncharacterized protein n=1 Tax=Stephania japonica TaxID=461633 RepID=A0AAP0EDM1_9MAGN
MKTNNSDRSLCSRLSACVDSRVWFRFRTTSVRKRRGLFNGGRETERLEPAHRWCRYLMRLSRLSMARDPRRRFRNPGLRKMQPHEKPNDHSVMDQDRFRVWSNVLFGATSSNINAQLQVVSWKQAMNNKVNEVMKRQKVMEEIISQLTSSMSHRDDNGNLEGKPCKLLHWIASGEVVAYGEISSTDPSALVDDVPLGPDCYKALATIPCNFAAIPSINKEKQALVAFITEHEYLFTAAEYSNLLKLKVPGRDISDDAGECVSDILFQ